MNYLSPETVSAGFFIDNSFDRLYVILAFGGASYGVYLLCHDNNIIYLISLCSVILFMIGLYFFNSILSGEFFLFLVVMYLDVPGKPLSLCSVHSRIT